ncbi:MAG: M15 family metallopeptidase [bacterium]|nr:M15 family metallopeptidase [bacterium]
MDSHDVQRDIGYERRKAAYKREYIKKKKRKRMIHNAIVIAIRLVAAAILLVICIKVIDALLPSVTQTSKKQETNKIAADQETDKEKEQETQTEALEAKSDIDPLLLVNNKNKLSEDVTPKLIEVYHGIFLDKCAADPLANMIEAANKAGYDVYAASGYHTKERQQVLYDAKVNEYISEGNSKKEAELMAKKEVALPEHSEYLTGLAVDILSADETQEDSQFGDTDAASWLKEHCGEYGFILRYPEEKEEITEMNYSASHYRYVGKEAAQQIMKQGIALEEYKTK